MAPMRLLIAVALFGTVAASQEHDSKIRRLSLLQRKDKKSRIAHRVRGEDISGAYADPKHEGHLRHLLAKGKTGTIKSTDDGATEWEVPITELTADSVVVDFSGKGGPKALSGKLTDEGMRGRHLSTHTHTPILARPTLGPGRVCTLPWLGHEGVFTDLGTRILLAWIGVNVWMLGVLGIKWSDGNTWTLMSAKASKGVTVHTCKTMCQRWGMKALGRAFDGIKMPQPCVTKCEEVYPEDALSSSLPPPPPPPFLLPCCPPLLFSPPAASSLLRFSSLVLEHLFA